MSIHELVQSAMEAEGMSAYKISMETGLSQGLLSRFLRGQSPLSLRALSLVLDALGYELTIRKKEN
nr:MAG TPA: Regulatory protein [Caudoviricetes sp.]